MKRTKTPLGPKCGEKHMGLSKKMAYPKCAIEIGKSDDDPREFWVPDSQVPNRSE